MKMDGRPRGGAFRLSRDHPISSMIIPNAPLCTYIRTYVRTYISMYNVMRRLYSKLKGLFGVLQTALVVISS